MNQAKESEVASEQSNAESIESNGTRMINPRAEIDTSPPFASVEEAVIRFGGRGPWIPHHLLRLAAHHADQVFDIDKMEEQAAQLEKDLMLKERETLNVLKELEVAKRFVEDLKLNLLKEVYSFLSRPDSSSEEQLSTANEKPEGSLTLCALPSPSLILMELNQAKSSLNKTTNDLAVIQASVDSLNKKMKIHKILLEKGSQSQISKPGGLSVEENCDKEKVKIPVPSNNAEIKGGLEKSTDILRKMPQVNFDFEAEQFRTMTEAARYEVVKAMSEIEQTKNTIDMVEMRLVAARKIEEAARAVEAIALAEKRPVGDDKRSTEVLVQNPEKTILSLEEYSALAQKAQKAEELSKKTVLSSENHVHDVNLSNVAFMRKFEDTTEEVKYSRMSLQEALGETDNMDRRKLHPEEGCFRIQSEYSQMQRSEHNAGKFKFRNSHRSLDHRDSHLLDRDESNDSNLMNDKSMPVLRSTISIGDVLNRKLILGDDITVEKHVEGHAERREVSLSQMLREKSGIILHPSKSTKEESVDKRFYTQRKKFGFIRVSFPKTKQSRKNAQTR